MARTRLELTPAQQAEADRIKAALIAAVATDLDDLARLLASKADRDLLGPTEFQVRDLVHAIGAKAIETALAGRKKGGMTGPRAAAPTATNRPSSSAGGPRRS
jgi:hypothetical protein